MGVKLGENFRIKEQENYKILLDSYLEDKHIDDNSKLKKTLFFLTTTFCVLKYEWKMSEVVTKRKRKEIFWIIQSTPEIFY